MKSVATRQLLLALSLVVSLVDQIANGLSHKMRRNCNAGQPMVGEDFPSSTAIVLVFQRFIDFKMIAPAGKLNPVISKVLGFLADGIKREVCPLPRK